MDHISDNKTIPANKPSDIELEACTALKQVIDPEININIVDLGLVYTIEYTEGLGLVVTVTLSSRNCPLGESILSDIRSTLENTFPSMRITVDLVWEPAWSPVYISPDGRKALGIE